MSFLVILIALLVERFFDWSHLRIWSWLPHAEGVIVRKFAGKHQPAWLALLLVGVGLLAVVGVLQIGLHDALYRVMECLFQLVVFLYCLGPVNLWADTFAKLNALSHGDRTGIGAVSGEFLKQTLMASHNRVFAIVCWFMILGPVGAVLYRVVSVTALGLQKQQPVPELVEPALKVQSVLDWISVRVLACAFALGGNFMKVFACWRNREVYRLEYNEMLLVSCGEAALGEELEKQDEVLQIRSALSLFDRALVVILVMLALAILF